MQQIIIKEIPIFKGYFASNDGFIYSMKKDGLKKLKSYDNRDKYQRVKINKNNLFVHQLVFITFFKTTPSIPAQANYSSIIYIHQFCKTLHSPKELAIDHIDNNNQNNSIWNLKVITQKQNLEKMHNRKRGK